MKAQLVVAKNKMEKSRSLFLRFSCASFSVVVNETKRSGGRGTLKAKKKRLEEWPAHGC